MTQETLFRKYRPQLLKEVVGQEHVVVTLTNSLLEKSIANAYLFSGPRGTGKTSVARILAKAVNCEKGISAEPCNQCASCLEIKRGNSMDVQEIDGASQRKVEDTRELRKEIFLAPGARRYKVYIIDEVHMLTEESFNTLLKVLEEPPERTVFILATTELHKIMPTIISRCQKYDFRRISQARIAEHLKEVAAKESIEAEEMALYLIARHAQGSLRDALVFLDQLASFSQKKIKMDDVTSLLGIASTDSLRDLSEQLQAKDPAGLLMKVKELHESGRDLKSFTRELIEHFHAIFLFRETGGDGPTPDDIREQAAWFSAHELMHIIETLIRALNEMKFSEDPRLILEMAFLKAIKSEDDASLEGILYRLSRLEQDTVKTDTETLLRQGFGGQTRRPSFAKASEGRRGDTETRKPEPAKDGPAIEKPLARQEVKQKVKNEAQPTEPEKPPTSNLSTATSSSLDFDKVKQAWPVVLSKAKENRIALYALLQHCRPAAFENGTLHIEILKPNEFYQTDLVKPSNQELVKEYYEQATGYRLELDFDYNTEKKTAEKESKTKAADEKTVKEEKVNIQDVLMDVFDAEIVSEISPEEEEAGLEALNEESDREEEKE